jgi:hypothetical protein
MPVTGGRGFRSVKLLWYKGVPPYKWVPLVDKRLEALGAPVRYLVSDRAKALLQLAEQGLECLSIPDVFHLVHDIVKSSALAIGRQLRQARQALQQAEARLQRHQEREPQHPMTREAMRQVEGTQAEVRRWETIQREYRQRLETLSLTLHPFAIEDSARQTSMQVESRVQAQVDAIEALAHSGYLLKAGQLEYDCRYSKMHGMPVTGGRGFRSLAIPISEFGLCSCGFLVYPP